MMRFALGVASVAVALAATVVPTPATTLVRRLPLEQVAAEAARVVHATVIDVHSDRDEWGAPATWITRKGASANAASAASLIERAPREPPNTSTQVSSSPIPNRSRAAARSVAGGGTGRPVTR